MKKAKKVISILLILCTLLTIVPYSVYALVWDGSSAGGSTNAVNGSNKGYVIRSTNDDNCVVGYRFSAVTSSGAMKITKVIDVYRKTTNGDNAYNTSAKFSTKYNKKQLIANKNAKLTTTENTTNCYKESSMGFTTALPNPSGVETWQKYEANINKVLSKIGVGSVSNMNYGDKVIIEPLFDVCLAGEYQALSVTEIAYCGRSVLGGSSNGGTSNGTSSTWGFIGNYTNRIWPNKLYTPDGQGLWTGVSAIGSSSKAAFDTILTKGYGAGIAYNETTNKTYTINFNGNGATSGSTASMSMTYGTAKNLNANGFVKTNYTFKNWNTKADGTGTSYTDKQSVNNLTSTAGGTVTLYAQWKANGYTINFNGNGATSGSTASMSMSYDVAKNLTANGFSKTGYIFENWNTNADGLGTAYTNQQSVKNLTSVNGGTVTLYAQWKPITYTIKFEGNGATSGSTASMTMTYDVEKSLTQNGFVKTGYQFFGWNTLPDGTGISYADEQSVKNLTTVNGSTITLYAQWDINSYTISFRGNGNTSGYTSSMIMKFDQSKALTSNGYSKTGYTFKNWNTSILGLGTSYSDGQVVKNLTNKDGGTVYLYAQWTANNYTIKFNGNGATGGSTASITMTYNVSQNLTANGFTKTGYVFDEWNTKSDGSGTSYANKESVKNLTTVDNGTVTLYAQWKPITYTIRFVGNGATSGSTASMSMTYDVAKNLTTNGFSKTSYKFVSWNTKADGSGTAYTDKQSVKNLTTVNNSVIILYAQWEFDPNLSVIQCDVYKGTKDDKTQLYGISTGNVFDDYEYKSGYPTIGDTIWFNIYFPAEKENITVRQYVSNGLGWTRRDVELSDIEETQWFPMQYMGKHCRVYEDTVCFEVKAKMDWLDSSGTVIKKGEEKTFYIPVKPVVYRNQVDATSFEVKTAAYDGMNGSDGKLYSGQRVTLSYSYTADNTWSACEYLRGSLYAHNGSSWQKVYKENEGFDAAKNKINISKDSPVTLNSAIGKYTVPLTSQNKIRFNMETWWASDKEHTTETTWYELPVVKSDIALTEIYLVDVRTNEVVDHNALEVGQVVIARFVYKNNTDAKVFVEGYYNDGQQVPAVYFIPANGTQTINAFAFEVPNQKTFNIWGGVYLEGLGLGNTSYETDGTNNDKTLKCKIKHPLRLTPIAQNAPYRENTEVVTSFWLNNTCSKQYTPNDNISVRFKVYNGSSVIKTFTKTNVIVPDYENNLLYFKWKVPTGLNGAKVKITGEIIDEGESYNLNSAMYSTTPYVNSITPDTQFQKKAPDGFTVKSTLQALSQVAQWWEWTYSSGSYTKKTYGIGIDNTSVSVLPATGSTAEKIGSLWYMKSGYGISLSYTNAAKSITGCVYPSATAFTLPQYSIAQFPEFEYSLETGKYKTLTVSSNTWSLPQNGAYGKVHFTPLWYPDGEYIVSVTQSDMWTPAGMIKRTLNANTIMIKDSAYDDWYIQH